MLNEYYAALLLGLWTARVDDG